MSGVVFSEELSTAVLFVDAFFDRSKLRVEVSLAVSVVVEIRDGVRLLVGGVRGIDRRPVWVWLSSSCALGGNGLLCSGAAFRSDYSHWEEQNI